MVKKRKLAPVPKRKLVAPVPTKKTSKTSKRSGGVAAAPAKSKKSGRVESAFDGFQFGNRSHGRGQGRGRSNIKKKCKVAGRVRSCSECLEEIKPTDHWKHVKTIHNDCGRKKVKIKQILKGKPDLLEKLEKLRTTDNPKYHRVINKITADKKHVKTSSEEKSAFLHELECLERTDQIETVKGYVLLDWVEFCEHFDRKGKTLKWKQKNWQSRVLDDTIPSQWDDEDDCQRVGVKKPPELLAKDILSFKTVKKGTDGAASAQALKSMAENFGNGNSLRSMRTFALMDGGNLGGPPKKQKVDHKELQAVKEECDEDDDDEGGKGEEEGAGHAVLATEVMQELQNRPEWKL